jgi:hypothetical protein
MKIVIAGYEIEPIRQTTDQPPVVVVREIGADPRSWRKLTPADARGLALVLSDAAMTAERA